MTALQERNAQFYDPLIVRQLGRDRWVLHSDIAYYSKVAKRSFFIPKGTEFDGASVPRIPFAFWFTGGRAFAAALIHDFLYRSKSWLDRKLADDIFLEAMGITDASLGYEAEPNWACNMMYNGVRAFGEEVWKNYGKPADPVVPAEPRGAGEQP
jgi:hypothetical protein